MRAPLLVLTLFWVVAIVLWQAKGSLFFLFNFGYIGTAVGVGIGLYIFLPREKKPAARRLAQLLVGLYLFGFLGLILKENMQLEGFFFYLLAGVFTGSVIHYAVAKIGGPLLFGRGYCGWACWTAMVLDFLPYQRNVNGRQPARWEKGRYPPWAASPFHGVHLLPDLHDRLPCPNSQLHLGRGQGRQGETHQKVTAPGPVLRRSAAAVISAAAPVAPMPDLIRSRAVLDSRAPCI